ncbi:MAG TPA: response regulator [Spirochaetia bacterium]|nr:response regulator [Spirochaetia bacterium]
MEKKPRILIVDDEPINLEFFELMLSKLGFKVELARDGEEALELVKQANPDLILLDGVLPKLSGWKVTRLLKTDDEYAAYRDIPIVMFSEMGDVQDKIEGYELGVEDYILKPFNFSEVLARIRAVLRNRALTLRIAKREQRIAMVESLNRSLVYFTRHLKEPVTQMAADARKLAQSNAEAVSAFVAEVIKQSEESLAAIKGLEDEISELENESDKELSEIDLKELEERFQTHLSQQKNGLREVPG